MGFNNSFSYFIHNIEMKKKSPNKSKNDPPFPGKDIDNSLGLTFDEMLSLDQKIKKSRENQKKES